MSLLSFSFLFVLSFTSFDQVRGSCGEFMATGIRIIGGVEADLWPWHGVIYNNGKYICGATLVAVNSLVTGAHCIQDKDQLEPLRADEIIVKLGKQDLLVDEPESIVVYPSKIIIHPEWNVRSKNYDADLAIIFLNTTVEYTNFIMPICLWKQDDEPNETTCTAVGYGKSEAPEFPNLLRELQVEVLTNEKCFLSNNQLALISSERTFCAGKDIHSGPCQGELNLVKKLFFYPNDKFFLYT